MNKEVISDKQGIALLALFIVGESSILVMGLDAGKDLWIATILAIFMALPMMVVYSRIHNIFPQKDLFEVIELCFGKLIGRTIIVLFTWYMLDLTALILRDFSNFIIIVSIPETPIIITMLGFIILCIWVAKEGIEELGRLAIFFVIIIVFLMVSTMLLLLPEFDINNIKPILAKGIIPVVKGAFGPFSIPFVETVAFSMVFSKFKTEKSPCQIYIKGLLIGGGLVFISSLSNILILGVNSILMLYFPTYTTISRLGIGTYFQRIEVIAALIFVLGGFIKASVTLLAACKGLTRIFGYNYYRFMVTPVALLILNLSYFEFDSVMYYEEWNKGIYPYYAFPFQVILPIIILIASKIKKNHLIQKNI